MAPTASTPAAARAAAPRPPQFSLERAIRSNILALLPYRCARDDYSEGILLDANENALGHALPPATTAAASAADAPAASQVDSQFLPPVFQNSSGW